MQKKKLHQTDKGGLFHMAKELAKTYEPQEVEDRIYDFWLNGMIVHIKKL